MAEIQPSITQENQATIIASLSSANQRSYDVSSSSESDVPFINRPKAMDFFSQPSSIQTQLQVDVVNFNLDLQRDLDALATILGSPSPHILPTSTPDNQISSRIPIVNTQRNSDAPLTQNSPESPILNNQRLPDLPSTPPDQSPGHVNSDIQRDDSSTLQNEEQRNIRNTISSNEANLVELLQACTDRKDLQLTVNKLVELILSHQKRQSTSPTNQDNNHLTNKFHPPPRRRNRNIATYNPNEASSIQKLYKTNRKRAINHILKPINHRYTGNTITTERYFTNLYDSYHQQNVHDLNNVLSIMPDFDDDDLTASPILPNEIELRLKNTCDSAPGQDHLVYSAIKKFDPSYKILAELFNTCIRLQLIPDSWKSSTTILIYKKNETDNPANFRPIVLQSALYKVFTGVMAKRIRQWAENNDIISPCQKGYGSGEGCHQHAFIIQAAINYAKTHHKKLYIAWLDIKNAFGSLPHSTLIATLKKCNINLVTLQLITDCLTGTQTSIRLDCDNSNPIPVKRGICQGDPLSGILFNLALEPLIRTVKASSTSFNVYSQEIDVLAFADDVTFLSSTHEGIQSMLDVAQSTASILGFDFQPDKSASLTISPNQQADHPEPLNLNNTQIKNLEKDEYYLYLGYPACVNYTRQPINSLVQKMTDDIHLLDKSLLAPWQKIDAYRAFIQPAAQFALRTSRSTKSSFNRFEKVLRAFIRNTCNLPQRASNHIAHADRNCGGFGLSDISVEPDIQTITQGIRMLTCSDETVKEIALNWLKESIAFALRSTKDKILPETIEKYFHHETKILRWHLASPWSQMRQAINRLNISLNHPELSTWYLSAAIPSQPSESQPQIFGNQSMVIQDECKTIKITSNTVIRQLHQLIRLRHSNALCKQRDQGKFARCASKTDYFGTASHANYNGLATRFCDWRFIHRARLNLLPLKSCQNRWNQSNANDAKCRRCGQTAETLPHVLQHCKPMMVPIRRRHDLIVQRIRRCIPAKFQIFADQHPPLGPNSRERPDLILIAENEVIIIDVAVTFEADHEALAKMRQMKVDKYVATADLYKSQGKSVAVYGFIVGALGTWLPSNDKILQSITCTKKYRSLFKKLCSSDVISASRDIYVEFLTSHRQYAA